MMRQYELVERVQKYDPSANEALLNRAYVYAMKAHGHQKRASGDPYLLPSPRSRGHPDRAQARRRHHCRRAAARRDRGHRRHARRDRPEVRQGDRRAGRGPHQDQEARSRHQEGRAGGELPQAAGRHLERHPRAADQARRSPAQHAHARAHEAGEPAARVRGDARDLCAARRPHGHAEHARGAGAAGLQVGLSRGLQGRRRQARRHPQEATPAWSRRSSPPCRPSSPAPAWRPRSTAARRSRSRSGARWRTGRSRWSSSPTSTASASWWTVSMPAIARSASCIRPGARCPAASRTTSRRPSRTTTSRSTPPWSARAISGSSCRSAPREMDQIAEYGVAAHALYKDGVRVGGDGAGPTAAVRAQGEPLHLAAPAGRHAARGRQSRGVPGAHQARAVPGPGVLLHAEGPPHRPAARRHAHRFRLCRAHRRRQLLRRRRHQRAAAAAHHPAQERRPGGDPDGQGPDAAGRLGAHRRHRQGAFRHPPRRARCAAQAVFRARPAPAGRRPSAGSARTTPTRSSRRACAG